MLRRLFELKPFSHLSTGFDNCCHGRTGFQFKQTTSNSVDQTDEESEEDLDQDHFNYLLDVNADNFGEDTDLLSLS